MDHADLSDSLTLLLVRLRVRRTPVPHCLTTPTSPQQTSLNGCLSTTVNYWGSNCPHNGVVSTVVCVECLGATVTARSPRPSTATVTLALSHYNSQKSIKHRLVQTETFTVHHILSSGYSKDQEHVLTFWRITSTRTVRTIWTNCQELAHCSSSRTWYKL